MKFLGATWDGDNDLTAVDPSTATPYSPARRYALADTLSHPTHGVGVVREVAPTKITVQFASGLRVLVHARGS